MKISDMLYEAAQDLWGEAAEKSFVREMAEGSLDEGLFRRYMIQDYLYLFDYIDTLRLIQSRTDDAEMTAFIGSCSNSWEKTALVSGTCFLLTALLYYFGQEWAGYMTLLPFVSGIRVMIAVSQREILPLVWLGWAAAGVLAVFMTKKRWINGA